MIRPSLVVYLPVTSQGQRSKYPLLSSAQEAASVSPLRLNALAARRFRWPRAQTHTGPAADQLSHQRKFEPLWEMGTHFNPDRIVYGFVINDLCRVKCPCLNGD